MIKDNYKLISIWLPLIVLQILIGLSAIILPLQITMLLALLGIFIIVSLIDVKWELYVLFLLVPIGESYISFKIYEGWSPLTTLIPFFIPFLMIIFMVETLSRLSRIRGNTVKTRFRIILFLLLSWAFVTLLWSPNIYHSLIYILVLFSCIYMFFLFINAINSEELHRKFMWLFIAYGVINAVFSIIFFYYPFEVIHYEFPVVGSLVLSISTPYNPFRASSLANASTLALILNFCSAITLGFILILKNRLKTTLLFVVLLLFFYVVLLSGSKGGTLGFLCMIFYFLYAIKKLRKRFLINSLLSVMLIVAISILVIVTFQMKYDNISPRIFAFLSSQSSQESESLATRGEMLACGFQNLISKTGGLGLVGGFSLYCPYPHAHNIYLSVLFDFGIVGSILLVVSIIIVSRYFITALKYQDTYLQTMFVAVFGGLVAMGVHGIVDHTWTKGFFWLYPAIVVATYNLVQKELHTLHNKEQVF